MSRYPRVHSVFRKNILRFVGLISETPFSSVTIALHGTTPTMLALLLMMCFLKPPVRMSCTGGFRLCEELALRGTA